MRFAAGFALFAVGLALGVGVGYGGSRNLEKAAAAARADCAALETRIAALETAPKCFEIHTDRTQIDLYPAPALGTQPKVAKAP